MDIPENLTNINNGDTPPTFDVKMLAQNFWSKTEVETFFQAIFTRSENKLVKDLQYVDPEHYCTAECETEHKEYTDYVAENVWKATREGLTIAKECFLKHITPIVDKHYNNPFRPAGFDKKMFVCQMFAILDSLYIDQEVNNAVLAKHIPAMRESDPDFKGVEYYLDVNVGVNVEELNDYELEEYGEALEEQDAYINLLTEVLNTYEKIPDTDPLRQLIYMTEGVEPYTVFFHVEHGASFFKTAVVEIIVEQLVPDLD